MDIKTSLVSKLNEYFVSNSVNTKLGTDIMSMISENNTDCLKIFSMPLYKDRLFCRQLFSDIKDSGYSCLTEYIKNGTESVVQCRECRRWNNTDDSHNACCGDDNEHGCNSSFRWINCRTPNCPADGNDGNDDSCRWNRVYYHYDDEVKNLPVWKPSGNVLIRRKTTPYKHLQSGSVSYKKKY